MCQRAKNRKVCKAIVTNQAQSQHQRKHQTDETDERESVVVVSLVGLVECNEAQEDDADENGTQNLY